MKTVTFFSYKGGTGRSLAVANASRYLARLGFKVATMDFDLEAPGLHYKFSRERDGRPLPVIAGVVDFLDEILHGNGSSPPDLRLCFISVPLDKTVEGSITLIPAGKVPSPEYWPKLAGINWHQLFYSDGGIGVKLFLELKQRIAEELKPDFLIIDSRTGVTEMAGVATSILADAVIAIVLRSPENLEGSRAVLRSLSKTRRSFGLPPLSITVALSRFPKPVSEDSEQQVIEDVRLFLNQPGEDLADTLAIEQVEVLHIDEALHQKEAMRVGGDVSPDDSILYRDYLRLFRCLVPIEIMEPRMGNILTSVRERIFDNPDSVERDLEEMAASYGNLNVYYELLRFYRVRNRNDRKALRSAETYWEISGRNGNDAILWYFVNGLFLRDEDDEDDDDDDDDEKPAPNLKFLESVWRGAGHRDGEVALLLAEKFNEAERPLEAMRILLDATEVLGVSGKVVGSAISLALKTQHPDEVRKLIDKYKSQLQGNEIFLEAWVNFAVETNSGPDLSSLASDPLLSLVKDKTSDRLVVRLLSSAGRREEAFVYADRLLSRARDAREFANLGVIFDELGAQGLLSERAKKQLSGQQLEEFNERLNRHFGRAYPRR